MREPLAPPGETTQVVASDVLVLAPHFDDEVLGCGGLLVDLIARGARVAVVFLSDGSGGREGADDPQEYSARRQEEAEQVAELLGFERLHFLGIPDGELLARRVELSRAIGKILETDVKRELAPDLVLVPSPLEVTEDHQATFAALHDVLSTVRGDDPVARACHKMQILTYEINHPGYPNMLVDVGAHLEPFKKAMGLYASQQERHDYLAAGLGLRQYRTHSLGPEVEAAEGYFALSLDDLRTRSLTQLIEHMGGAAKSLEVTVGPLVSVVVRTHDRADLLAEALASIAASTYRQVEVVLVRDGGPKVDLPVEFPFDVKRVDFEVNRGRAAAANAGVEAATGEWIAFLDDDDLYAPEHLETLVRSAKAEGVEVVYSDATVAVYELDGEGSSSSGSSGSGSSGWLNRERRLPYSRDFNFDRLLVDNYIPFNTLLIRRERLQSTADPLTGQIFDVELPFFEDWDALIRLGRTTRFIHIPRVTCEYRHFRDASHHVLGGDATSRSGFERDFAAMKARVLTKNQSLLDPDALARAVTDLRDEAVELREALNTARFELDGERRERMRLKTEAQRLYDDEAALRQTVEEQTEHIGRTYAEIERLGEVIRQMESTRAWRWHQRFKRVGGSAEPKGGSS